MFKLAAFAIISNQSKEILLCHRRDHDLWNLPGGKVEQHETPWDGVIRETHEETGLIVRTIHLSGIYGKPHKNEIVFSFTCAIVRGNITLTNEADQRKYFALKDIPTNTVPKQLERIKDYLANPTTTHYKTQQ